MFFKAALLAGVIGLSVAVQRDARVLQPGVLTQSAVCNTGLALGDTARFTGVMSSLGVISFPADPVRPPGSLILWMDRDGRLHYSESWLSDTVRSVWEGEVGFGSGGMPRAYTTRRTRGRVVVATEHMDHNGDSVVLVRNDRQTTERLNRDAVPVPGFGSAPLVALLAQCAVSVPNREFRTNDWGTVRARELTSITLHAGARSQSATLYLLSADSSAQLDAVWLDPRTHRLIAARGANGGMDLVAEGWERSLDQLLEAEVRAARPPGFRETCANGVGPGGCELHASLVSSACRYLLARVKPNRNGGTLTLADSGYTVTSDGLGPYRSGSSNVRVVTGGVGAAFVLDGQPRTTSRTFSVDLRHPVPGDTGIPLSLIKADAVWPGPFMPAGSNYSLEISFLYHNADTTAFMNDIPVGTTVHANSIGLNLYVNGLAHVLQMGPAPWGGFCSADGSAVFGDGTTVATISRPSATSWVVDLPPGSIGRLFDIHGEDRNAVNKGLYYVSLHLMIEQ